MTKSLKLDGKGQYLARIEDVDAFTIRVYNEEVYNFGVYNYPPILDTIENKWTIAFWVRPLEHKEHAAIFSMRTTDASNEIRISTTPISAQQEVSSEMRVLIKNAEGSIIKHYSWPDWFQNETWTHTTVRWYGTTLDAFTEGLTTTTGVNFVNTSGDMSATDREMYYGSTNPGSFATFSGVLGHFGIWDLVVGSEELPTIVSGGFSIDLTVSSGSYTSQDNLKQYWKPGDDPLNLGKDFSIFGPAFDLEKEREVDPTNIVTDEPTF